MEDYPLANLLNETKAQTQHSEEWLHAFLTEVGLTQRLFRAEMDDASLEAYRQAIQDLSARELELAFTEARKRHKEYMPSPAQVREYLREARESIPRPRPADCPRCCGSGWYVAKAGDTAQRCKHELSAGAA